MRLRRCILISALLLAAVAAFTQQDPEALYDRALAAYRADAFEEAIRLFEQFRAAAPGNAKADDALWYIGRALAHLGRAAEAEERFEAVRAQGERGNRYVEATTELARIRLKAGDPSAAIALLEPLKKQKDLDVEDRRALRLLADARVELGRADQKARRDEQARAGFETAVSEYESLLREPGSDRERLGLLEDVGHTYVRLMETAGDRQALAKYRAEALRALDQALALNPPEPQRKRLQRLRDQAEASASASTSRRARIEGLGGAAYAAIQNPTASTVWAPGAQAAAELGLTKPVGWRRQLQLEARFAHDDFSLKTFSFGGDTEAGRILQRTEDFGAALAWEAGSARGLRSLLKVTGDYRLAEDPELSALNLKAAEKLDWPAGEAWKLELDGRVAYALYPFYSTASGRELDHLLAGLKPRATWYLSPDFSLGLGYGFAFKQYLNAKYDTLAGPDTATKNKQYFTHTAELTLRATPGRVVHPTLTYSFTYNKTRNYDLDLTGIGGGFVRGYYDYYENALDLGLRCKWNPDFRTDLNARASLQNFLNYPARDAGNTLTGELRRDIGLAAEADLSYRFLKKERNGFGDLSALLRLTYAQNISNSYYEDFFQTNYSALALTGGLSLELK